MTEVQWPGEWLRGALEMCVLGVLADGSAYGYLIAQRLEEAGLGVIKGGTLYPLLGRLEREGLVTAAWRAGEGGPGRKYFELTGPGRAELDDRSLMWQRFVEGTWRLLPPCPQQSTSHTGGRT